MADPPPSPLALRNVRLFLAFRLLFGARFYYPVFTILFLDYGLSLEQFSLLNVVWAATIVLAEVPSGALADLVGRRRLVVLAAGLMLVELATIGFVPLGDPDLVLAAFVVNRVCSGLAEASASGADEALAYDSLASVGLEGSWPLVLERLGKLSAVAFFVAMITGALVYDLDVVNAVARALGGAGSWTRADLVRAPILMTLATGCVAFGVALQLEEVGAPREPASWQSLRAAFGQVFETARWILAAPFVLLVILAGLALDSVARQFVLLGSEYFRAVEIPTYLLGPIMAGVSLLGIVSSKVSRVLSERCRPVTNFLILSVFLCANLVGASWGIPGWGLVFALGPFLVLGSVGFLQSHYINANVESKRRATALSFKGLALNLGMGSASILYAGLLRGLEGGGAEGDALFFASLGWFAPYSALLGALVLGGGALLLRGGRGAARV